MPTTSKLIVKQLRVARPRTVPALYNPYSTGRTGIREFGAKYIIHALATMSNLLLATAAVILVIISSTIITAASQAFAIVGYAPEYRLQHVNNHAAAILPRLTDIVLFSVETDGMGNLRELRRVLPPPKHIRTAAANGSLRVFVSVGGGGRSAGFPAMVASSDARKLFVKNTLELAEKHSLAGIDLDWESPTTRADVENFATLLTEMKAAFSPRGLLVSTAIHSWQGLTVEGFDAADRVYLMAYDGIDAQGRHSTMQHAQRAVLELMKHARATSRGRTQIAKKIFLGIPAYGRRMARPRDVMTYAELSRAHVLKGKKNVVCGLNPASDESPGDGFFYNGPDTVAAKVRWSRVEAKLGGVFFWEIGHDVVGDSAQYMYVRNNTNDSDSANEYSEREDHSTPCIPLLLAAHSECPESSLHDLASDALRRATEHDWRKAMRIKRRQKKEARRARKRKSKERYNNKKEEL